MKNDREKWARIRIIMVSCLFAFGFLAVTCRSFYLQVIQHDELVKRAERQHQRTIQITPARGGIFDRNGTPLAVSLEMDSLFAEPRRIKEPAAVSALIAPVLGLSHQELVKKLSSEKGFVWVARQISPDVAMKIREHKLAGIGFVKENKRFYPNFEMASHVIGFTGLDPDGLEGIERRYDREIMGKKGCLLTERDALGRDVSMQNAVMKNPVPGKNITLTLDKNIQYFTEKELAKAVQGSDAKGGIAVVADPATGKILAMANYPAFNPNSFRQYPTLHLRNRAVADSFEPGSTFKLFLMAAAIEEKIVRPQDGINCENGRYSFGGRIIRDDHPHGRVSITEVLKYSSNIGSAKIGIKLGDDRLHRYLQAFGFGQKSGVDLPGEASGGLRPVSRWYGTDLATISFGQGVSTTAIQLVSAVSAIANGGLLMKPYLVESITDGSEQELQHFDPQTVRRVISAETAATVTKMMNSVTEKGGTGTNAAIEGFKVAGKTGTAQKVDPVSKGYSASKRTASFVGFVPSDKPLLTILIVIDEPKTSPYGGVVAAPAFREIAFNSLCYLKAAGIGKTCSLPKQEQPLEAKVRTVSSSAVPAEAEGGIMDVAGTGTSMPDFRGMSMRRVLQVMGKRQLNLQLRGSGRVIEQHPQPGQVIRGSDEIWVRLAPSA